MINDKILVVLLIITILLSVVTIGITLSLSDEYAPKLLNPKNLVDVNHANVGFTIAPTSENQGLT